LEVAVGLATLVSWLLTAGIGARMLRSAVAAGALRRPQASGDGVFPGLLFAHFGLALTGLAAWTCHLVTGQGWLAWAALGLLALAVGLGISTVTLWTPYPGPAPDDDTPAMATGALAIDDLIDQLLADPAPAGARVRWRLRALIPVGHGIGALITFMLALLTTVGMR
jgi:hypothetical protein